MAKQQKKEKAYGDRMKSKPQEVERVVGCMVVSGKDSSGKQHHKSATD